MNGPVLSRRRFIAISAAAGAGACGLSGPARAAPYHWRGTALGAHASLTFDALPHDRAATLCARVEREVSRLEDIFSLYRPDSAINALNRSGALDAPPLEFVDLVSKSDTLWRATNGYFDPTIQPVWAVMRSGNGMPGSAALQAAHGLVGWHKVRFDAARIAFGEPGMALSLNGIAQGYITDKVAALLRAQGMTNILVSMGEIAALGSKADGEPWRVGIAEREDREAEAQVDLADRALATSAPAGSHLSGGEQGTQSHIINPVDRDAPPRWRYVSVTHPSATVADGLSTAAVFQTARDMAASTARFPGAQVVGRA